MSRRQLRGKTVQRRIENAARRKEEVDHKADLKRRREKAAVRRAEKRAEKKAAGLAEKAAVK